MVFLLYYTGSNRAAQKKFEQEYSIKLAAAQQYKIKIPDIPQTEKIDLPENVVRRLHKSLRSRNPNEAFKAVELLWRNQDPVVIPAIKKVLSLKMTYCWDNCEALGEMKERVFDLVSRDMSQLNFEFLCISAADHNRSFRLRAVNAISGYYTDEALAVMNRALNDRDSEIRTAAIDGIMKINEGIKQKRQEKIDALNSEYRNRRRFGPKISPEDIMKAMN
jgi:hypothetical protein